MNRFVTGDGAPRAPEREEMLARVDPTLDRPVILFQDIIEILHGAVSAVVGQIACVLEHGNGGWISGVLVAIDDPRLRMVLSAQGFGQKALSRCCIAFSRREGSRSSHRWSPPPGTSTPICLSPARTSRQPPRVVRRLEVPAQ